MKKRQDDFENSMPFYAAVTKHKTSAEIISEARAIINKDNSADSSMISITDGSSGLRTLGTQRPFTPRERQRTLFGKVRRPSRPPSAVSLKYLKYQNDATVKIERKLNASSSFDEHMINCFSLENIDEKPELSSFQRNTSDFISKTKSLNVELDYTDHQTHNAFKIKLPSLNGSSKPLHQRKVSGSLSFFNSNAFENGGEKSSSLIMCKSENIILPRTDSVQDKVELYEKNPSLQRTSTDVFKKRRLFGNMKSKSECAPDSDYEKNFEDDKISFYKVEPNIEEKNLEHCVSGKQISKLKIDLPISSPKLITKENNQSINNDKVQNTTKSSKLHAINHILENLSNKESKFFSDGDVIEMLSILYDAIEKEMIQQHINNDEKIAILRTLYKYIESPNERLLISMARIILALRVTGNNLSGVCKLIFKIARNDKNDNLFLHENLLELFIVGLGRAEPLHDAECLVYGYGALKFLGMNPVLLERIRPLGVLPLMTLHLKMFNEARLENIYLVGEQGCHGLYQLTGALRNLAGGDMLWNNSLINDKCSNSSSPCNNLLEFITEGTLNEICKTLNLYADDIDIEINVSRTLSVLSADFECCVALCEQKGILTSIIKLLQNYIEKTPLVVRLTYITGNMMACNNDICLQLYNESNSLQVLLKILELYLKQCWPNYKIDNAENIIIGSDLDGSNGSNEDVMVKTIRIIANMCMNPIVGMYMMEAENYGESIFSWMLKCLRQYMPSENTELIVSSLATLNNISYYHVEDQKISAFSKFQLYFCEVLCYFISQDISACVIEAMRVLGNMSRSNVTVDYILNTGSLRDIMKSLKDDNLELSVAAAGVLVNITADEKGRKIWLKEGGIIESIYVIQNAAINHHWQLAHLICQALWNASPLPPTEASMLTPLLLDILDEKHVFGNIKMMNLQDSECHIMKNISPVQENYMLTHAAWEEFAAVAVNLLEKIDPTLDVWNEEYTNN